MIRIYLTSNGVEGYNEGCSCCSSEEHATVDDINKLIKSLNEQIGKLNILSTLIEMHGEDKVTYWYKEYENMKYAKSQIDAAEEYRKNPNIQGTFCKESFDNLNEALKEYNAICKRFKRVPQAFKRYIEIDK